ncbi:helix-turn-helix domain-containing protein [Xanthomonas sacchari]|uniref:helix-turn-helix domain-containing protein n=1 Tax=Xanthomonas sacchari TaxID=56458 RepID=UPI0012E0333F
MPAVRPRLEQLDWLDAHSRVTRRLAGSVARLCAATSVRHAARWHEIDWKTAKRSTSGRWSDAWAGGPGWRMPDCDG